VPAESRELEAAEADDESTSWSLSSSSWARDCWSKRKATRSCQRGARGSCTWQQRTDSGQTDKDNERAMREKTRAIEYGQQQKLERNRLYVIMLCLRAELRRVRWTTRSRGGARRTRVCVSVCRGNMACRYQLKDPKLRGMERQSQFGLPAGGSI
jgi:hypothetical protein